MSDVAKPFGISEVHVRRFALRAAWLRRAAYLILFVIFCLIVAGALVYQLAADDDPSHSDVDPDNAYYWRFNRRRLDAEGIRDALLHVSGSLDPKVGGASLQLDDEKNDRRTIYGEVSRFQVNEYLQTFDFPNPSLTAERRFSTNVPLQSLYFMNSPFVQAQAENLVKRLARETEKESAVADESDDSEDDPAPVRSEEDEGDDAEADDDIPESLDDRAMLERAYPLLYGRTVTGQEIELGLTFLGEQRASWLEQELAELAKADEEAEDGPDGDEDDERAGLAERRAAMKAWVQYARVLFGTAEFRYIG